MFPGSRSVPAVDDKYSGPVVTSEIFITLISILINLSGIKTSGLTLEAPGFQSGLSPSVLLFTETWLL